MPEKYTQREKEVELGISTRNRNGAGKKVYFWKISKWSREVEVKLENMNDEKKFQSEAEVKLEKIGVEKMSKWNSEAGVAERKFQGEASFTSAPPSLNEQKELRKKTDTLSWVFEKLPK